MKFQFNSPSNVHSFDFYLTSYSTQSIMEIFPCEFLLKIFLFLLINWNSNMINESISFSYERGRLKNWIRDWIICQRLRKKERIEQR